MTFEASAEVYDRHVGRYGSELAAALMQAARVAPGGRALDVGCGPGVLTRVLAELLGSANVAAVDPSEPFVEACHERVPGADVRLAGAEALPFTDGEFDFNFMADPEAGVGEMRRVARRGGAVAACVWDYPGEMTMLRAFWDAALELDPAAPDEGRTMRFCRQGELADLWRRCDLADVEEGAFLIEAAYGNFDDYWAPFPTGVAPSGAYCASLDAARQEALREACFRRLGAPAGPFTLTARAWYTVGSA